SSSIPRSRSESVTLRSWTSPAAGVGSTLSGAGASASVRRQPSGDCRRARLRVAPERRGTVAVPADRRVRVHLRLPHGRAQRTRRRDRLALRAELRLAERVRQSARPPGRLLPLRPVRHQPPAAVAYVTGTNVLETTWRTPSGWVVVRDALTMHP